MKITVRLLGYLSIVLIAVAVAIAFYFESPRIALVVLCVMLIVWFKAMDKIDAVGRAERDKRFAEIVQEQRRIECVLNNVETQKCRHRPCVPRVHRNAHLC